MSRVSEWLETLSLSQYEQDFDQHAIEFEQLTDLDHDVLKDIGVVTAGHRLTILKAAKSLAANSADATESVPPTHAERRHLTVMFVDLVGSTELSRRYDPEVVRDTVQTYQNTVAGIVGRFEGFVARFMGDGVLCYFGWPQAHEHDAERAVRAGLAIAADVAEISAPDGAPLAARIGIASGVVVVGDLIGSGASEEAAVVGETPNLAARLQGAAQPGQVVIAKATRNIIGDVYSYIALGPHEFKGIDEPTEYFAVEAEKFITARFEARRSSDLDVMVGRDEELGLLKDRWNQASSGDGQMVVLTGEAGIGKSRIVQGLLDELDDSPHIRIRLQCSPYHIDTSLYPVIQYLSVAAGFESNDNDEVRLVKLEALLTDRGIHSGTTISLLANLVGLTEQAQVPVGVQNMEPQQRRSKTLEALVTMITGQAVEQPILFVVEDVHWIDPTTQELLSRLLQALDQIRVLTLLTARPIFQENFGAHPCLTQLALNRLGRDQVAGIVNRIANGKEIPDELLVEIVQRADGVALFVEELTKTILELPMLRETDTQWVLDGPLKDVVIPNSIHDSLLARLDRLNSAKDVAQTAACLGRDFDISVLEKICGLNSEELNDALTQLIDSEILFRRGASPSVTYVFRHALVRDAAYSSLLKSSRQQIHSLISDQLQLDESVNTSAAIIAFHCREAERLDESITYYERAIDIAIDALSYQEALNLIQSALEVASKLVDPTERNIAIARLHTVRLHNYQSVYGFGSPEAVAVGTELEQALANTECLQTRAAGLRRVHMLYAYSYPKRAGTLGRELVDIADEIHDVDLMIKSRMDQGFSLYQQGNYSQCVATLEAAWKIAQPLFIESGVEGMKAYGNCLNLVAQLSMCLWIHGSSERSTELHGLLLSHRLEQARDPVQLYIRQFLCQSYWMRQDLESIRSHLDWMDNCYHRSGYPLAKNIAHWCRGLLCLASGDASGAIKEITAHIDSTPDYVKNPQLWCVIAQAHHASGDIDSARAALVTAKDHMESRGKFFWSPEYYRIHAEVLIADNAHAQDIDEMLSRSEEEATRIGARFFLLRTGLTHVKYLHSIGEHALGHARANDLVDQFRGAAAYGEYSELINLAGNGLSGSNL